MVLPFYYQPLFSKHQSIFIAVVKLMGRSAGEEFGVGKALFPLIFPKTWATEYFG